MNKKAAAKWDRTWLLPGLLLCLAAPSPALPASGLPGIGTLGAFQTSDGAPAAQTPPLPALHAELEGLEGEAFDLRVAGLLEGSDPQVVVDAILLRAGRPSPPGLSGARAERRAARREGARAWMGLDQRWLARARDLVAAVNTDEDLRCAALSSLGDSGQLRVAPDLAWALGAGRYSPRVQEYAREALLELTGRRFRDAEHFASVSAGWSARTREGIFAAELLAREREIEGLKAALLGGDSTRIVDALENGTPALRAEAAGVIARGVGRQGRTLDQAAGLLFEQLEEEHHPEVLHATLQSLVGLLEGLEADAELVQRARSLLGGGDLADRLELAPSIAEALARLPEAGEGLVHSAARVAGLVARLAATDRPVDYEALSLGLDALERLLGRMGEDSVVFDPVTPAREVVLDLLIRTAVPAQVRLEAARAAGWVLTAASFDDLLDALERADSERLRLELLGSVARLAVELDPDALAADRVLAGLEGWIAAPGADLRLRAVELLRGESLEGLRQRARLTGVPGHLVERLGVEPLPAVRDALLETLAELGPAAPQARDLAALPSFDTFLDDNHRRSMRMARCLRALVGEDAAAAVLVASRLSADRREAPPADGAGSVDRLKAALHVVTGPGEEGVVPWPAADHGLVLGWALELLAAGVLPELEVLDRLLGVHLPRATDLPALGAARLLAAQDLLRAADELERDVAGVGGAFERALEEGSDQKAVLLVRARWLFDGGDPLASALDWDELLFPEGSIEPATALAPADMRRARAAYEGDPVRAARVALALVDEPAWPALDPGARLADLLAMADLALVSGVSELQLAARGHLVGVPPTEEGEALPEFLAGARWSGTLQRKADHEALWRRVEALSGALQPPGGEEEEAEEGVEDPPADGEGTGRTP